MSESKDLKSNVKFFYGGEGILVVFVVFKIVVFIVFAIILTFV
jgi:hypothetical protein